MAMEVSTEVPCFRYLRSLWALELSWLRRPEDDSSCDPMVKRNSTVFIAEVLAFFKAAYQPWQLICSWYMWWPCDFPQVYVWCCGSREGFEWRSRTCRARTRPAEVFWKGCTKKWQSGKMWRSPTRSSLILWIWLFWTMWTKTWARILWFTAAAFS